MGDVNEVGAVARDPDPGKGGQQQRLVPHLRGAVPGRVDLDRALQ